MSGRAGVRADVTCCPGQRFVHTGGCRIRTARRRSLREETEGSGWTQETVPGASHTPRGLPASDPRPLTSGLLCRPPPSRPPSSPAPAPAGPCHREGGSRQARDRVCPPRWKHSAGSEEEDRAPRFPLMTPGPQSQKACPHRGPSLGVTGCSSPSAPPSGTRDKRHSPALPSGAPYLLAEASLGNCSLSSLALVPIACPRSHQGPLPLSCGPDLLAWGREEARKMVSSK